MKFLRKLATRLQGWVEQLFPNWAHRRHRHKWERQWANPEYSPFWKTERPQKEFVEAIASGWFDKEQLVLDVGCGNGEVSRWLSAQGFAVTGLDYSAAAIENCRRLAVCAQSDLNFQVADLCSNDLHIEPAGSLIDRGCFHRIAENFRLVFRAEHRSRHPPTRPLSPPLRKRSRTLDSQTIAAPGRSPNCASMWSQSSANTSRLTGRTPR